MELEIKKFILEKYGYEGELTKLAGYEDMNFLITTPQGQKYVVKLSSKIQSFQFLEAQYIIFEELKSISDYTFPHVVHGIDNQYMYRFITSDNVVYLLRILSYIEGDFLANKPITTELLFGFGKFLATLDKQLENVSIPAIEARREEWDLKYFTDNSKYIQFIRDKSKRRFVEYTLLQFNENVLPEIPRLRKGIIHNDANDWNVVISSKGRWGIIDFGDMVSSPYINELAIAATYISMDSKDPIARVADLLKGYHSRMPLEPIELDLLYFLIAARIATSVCQSAYSIRNNPENTYINAHERKAWDLLEKWVSISPDFAAAEFYNACGLDSAQKVAEDKFTKERDEHFSKSLSLSYSKPIYMVKGAFQYMFDQHGKTYVDLVNNIMHVGHCHPKVVAASHRQMSMLNTNTRYLYKSLNLYANELLEKFQAPLNQVFFVNSGSAATDLALRLARNYTGSKDMIVMEHGYHGNTTAAIEVSSYKFNGKGGSGPEPYIHIAPIPDTYHSDFEKDDLGTTDYYSSKIDPFLDKRIAGFICESIVGCGGQVVLPDGYFKEVYAKVRKAGGICIADEVQTGFGRIGSHFWAYETQNVIPDIVILGKPMGNGHPVAAVVTTDEIAKAFETGMEFFSSFGGNPVSCEIGRSVLQVIDEENLMANAYEVGKYFLNGFNTLMASHNLVGQARGMGLFLGLELVKKGNEKVPATEEAKMVVNQMKENGFLLSTDGPFNNVLKIKPPMCINIKNAHDMLEALNDTLLQIEKQVNN